MTQYAINGIHIEVETRGDDKAPAFLLIRGLSTQLVHWPESFLDLFVEAGLRPVIFDSRDCGLSTHFDQAGLPNTAGILAGTHEPAYRVSDMAADAVGVLDALGIEKAYAAGVSLGGMIAQHLAISHGDRFMGIASIMSSSGADGLPGGRADVLARMSARLPEDASREEIISNSVETQRLISSPGFMPTEEELRRYIEVGVDRALCPEGSARQMAAVLGDGSRANRLAEVSLPFLVIHGTDDPLLPLAGGEDTAKRVAGAELEVIEGMGHDITERNGAVVAERLIAFARAHSGE